MTSDAQLSTKQLVDDDASLEATFVPAAGMLCASLRHRGEELLAQNEGVDAYARHGKTMGVPLLYPWANRLGAFDYRVAGTAVTVPHDPARVALDGNGLPIHGVIGGCQRYETVDAGTLQDRSLEARLRWDRSQPQLFEVFPFEHDVRYAARLTGGSLTIDIEVTASGLDAVPVAFGFHPYLSLAGLPRERWLIELPAMRTLELDTMQIPVGAGPVRPESRFELADETFDDGFDSLAEPARFSAAGAGRRIEVAFSTGYPCAQVFTPPASSFICFEPMTAPANALRSGEQLRVLAPGERYAASFSIGVRDVDG